MVRISNMAFFYALLFATAALTVCCMEDSQEMMSRKMESRKQLDFSGEAQSIADFGKTAEVHIDYDPPGANNKHSPVPPPLVRN